MLKKFGKILLYLTFFFLLALLIIVILAKIYNKEIKEYALSYLNQYLTTEVHVDNVRLDLLKRFPQATLVFENAHIEDANNSAAGDTMLFAKELLLKFDFLEVFKGKYTVDQIEARDAYLNLSVNAAGKENYLIWEQTDSVKKKEFQFRLEKVICTDTKVHYHNELTNQSYKGNASHIELTGAFSESDFDLTINSDLIINSITIDQLTYLKNERSTIETVLSIDKVNRKYSIDKGTALIGNLNFEITGEYLAEISHCDLILKGRDLALNNVFTVFPSVFFEKFNHYKSDGILTFNATIIGPCSKASIPEIHAEFSIEDGQLTEAQTGMKLHGLNFSGSFTNSDFGALDITTLTGSLLNSQFNGSISLKNFDTPDVDISINGSLNLSAVHEFFQFESVEYLNGQMDFSARVLGKSESGKFRTKRSSGNFSIENVNLKTNLNALEYSDLNGSFSLKNGNATVSSCSGNIFNSDFNIAGVLRNFIPFILSRNETLTIEADLDSRFIDLSRITSMASSANESRSYAPESILPRNLAFNLNTTVENLNYGKFDAIDIRGVASLRDQVLEGRNVRFKANDGTYRSNFEFDGSNANNYLFSANGKLRGIDIKNLFEEFDNFGQKFIQGRHLNGRTDATLDFACALDNGFVIKQETILSNIDIDVEEGELTDLEVLQEIALYIEQDKLLKPFVNTDLMAQKLKSVRFSKLSNTIEISKEAITIPRMDISSNVMDIGIKGEHQFNNRIDYGFNFRLRDALMKENKESEFGPIIDDGTGYRIYLSMTGTVDDPVFGIDKDEKRLARKKKVQSEKQTLKAVLKEELGLYKKDSSIGSVKAKNKSDVQFEVEWDESDTSVSPVENEFSQGKRRERRNVMKNWLKNIESKFDSSGTKDSVHLEFDNN